MLDQMVESKDTLKESKTLFYLFSFLIVFAVVSVIGVGIWHLGNLLGYYQQGGMSGDLELTSLVAPVPVEAEEPPPVEEKVEKVTKVEQNVDTRTEIIQNMMESPKEPDKVQTTKNTVEQRRLDTKTVLDSSNSNAVNPLRNDSSDETVRQSQGVGDQVGKTLSDGDEPVMQQTPKPTVAATPKPVPKTVSGGVVNGKARNLVTPQYPSSARAVRAAGQVSVAVTIDENGNVISANATSGHTLLRSAAESAARASKFNPTLLSGQPVKVTGIIIYNFVP